MSNKSWKTSNNASLNNTPKILVTNNSLINNNSSI